MVFCKHPNGDAGNVRPADLFCADGKKRGEVGMNRMSWSIPSKEEAEEFTRSYLAAQEAYYEEHMDDCCETCDFYEEGLNFPNMVRGNESPCTTL